METAGIGVDLVSVGRMERALARSPRLRDRLFTAEEQAYCDSRARPAEHYAARFAAREAVLKALGCGFAGMGLKDVSVCIDAAGRPRAVLSGEARSVAEALGVIEVALSLSHTREVAVANAVAVTEAAQPRKEERPSAEDDLRTSFREAREVLFDLERVEQAQAERPAGGDGHE